MFGFKRPIRWWNNESVDATAKNVLHRLVWLAFAWSFCHLPPALRKWLFWPCYLSQYICEWALECVYHSLSKGGAVSVHFLLLRPLQVVFGGANRTASKWEGWLSPSLISGSQPACQPACQPAFAVEKLRQTPFFFFELLCNFHKFSLCFMGRKAGKVPVLCFVFSLDRHISGY